MERVHPEAFDVTDEFKHIRQARERKAEELARSFVEGGMWLARQNDPVRQFEEMTLRAAIINAANREEAQKQFQEIVNLGETDASRAFDLMCGLAILRVEPQAFYSALLRARISEVLARESFKELVEKEKIELSDFYDLKQNITEWNFTKEYLNKNYTELTPRYEIYWIFDKKNPTKLPKKTNRGWDDIITRE